jgi:DNA primase
MSWKLDTLPGGGLRRWLMTLGYSLSGLQQAGLVNASGLDTFSHRVVFPLEANLYGRSVGNAAPHLFLPGPKGGLYRWERVKHYPEIILVEGVFDLAVLLQAGFPNVTCALGNRLNALQMRQLCDSPKTVYLAFDADANGSGQQAAQSLSRHLTDQGARALRVELPHGHDPNSFFAGGGDRNHFRHFLERADSCLFV